MSHTPTTGIDAHTWAAVLSALTAAGATDAGDPAVLDALPDAPDEGHIAATYTEHAPTGAPAWDQLTAARRADADAAYRDGFDTALTDEIAHHCSQAVDIGPTTAPAYATITRPVAGGM